MAAKAQSGALPFGPVAGACRARMARAAADLTVVEGIGGLMSPIADAATSLDLIEALSCQAILVGGDLGAVSHTLTALEVLRARALAPAAVLISEDQPRRARLPSHGGPHAGRRPSARRPLSRCPAAPGRAGPARCFRDSELDRRGPSFHGR